MVSGPEHLRANDPRLPVLHAVLATGHSQTTRAVLAEVAGVSKRSVINVIGELSESAVLAREPVRLGPACGLVLSIALGSESMRGGLLDANGTLHHESKLKARPGQLDQTPHELLGRIRRLAYDILGRGLSDASLRVGQSRALRMLGFNVAWPCPIDRRGFTRGRVLSNVEWHVPRPGDPERLSLAQHAAEALGPPFAEHLERASAINDANADALSVAFDHARSRALQPDETDAPRVILTVRIGGGLGAAIVELATHRSNVLAFIDARLMVGTNGYAGELGHLPISPTTVTEITKDAPEGLAAIDFKHWSCSCGGHGHLESLASGTAFARRMEASGHQLMNDDARAIARTRELIQDRGNVHAQRALMDCGRLVGRALANPILMHDPHTVALTGYFADEQIVKGILRERGIWGSTIGDTVAIEALEHDRYAFNAARGAGLAVVRRLVMRELPRLLSTTTVDALTFPFDAEHLELMSR